MNVQEELLPFPQCSSCRGGGGGGGITVKILKFGTPQTIAIIILTIEKFDVTLH